MKALVLSSGGVDSTTCVGIAVNKYGAENVSTLSVYYGQKHDKEMKSARNIAKYYGVELMELNLADIFSKSDCSLLKRSNKEIPQQSYADQLKKTKGNPVSTYVPFRNGLMLSAAASVAVSVGAHRIYYGAHADDAAGNAYPDCSQYFTHCINHAIYTGTGNQVCVIAPFIDKTKSDIVKIGMQLKVPYEITWSCYNGGDKPCGKCGTCIDRLKAFEINGLEDPLKY